MTNVWVKRGVDPSGRFGPEISCEGGPSADEGLGAVFGQKRTQAIATLAVLREGVNEALGDLRAS